MPRSNYCSMVNNIIRLQKNILMIKVDIARSMVKDTLTQSDQMANTSQRALPLAKKECKNFAETTLVASAPRVKMIALTGELRMNIILLIKTTMALIKNL